MWIHKTRATFSFEELGCLFAFLNKTLPESVSLDDEGARKGLELLWRLDERLKERGLTGLRVYQPRLTIAHKEKDTR